MRAIILLFANILFNSIPVKYRDNAESFAINKYTSERGRKCQSYKMFESSKVSAAHFGRRDRNGDFGLPKRYVTSTVEITFCHWLHSTVSTPTVRTRKWLFTEAKPKSKDSTRLLKITASIILKVNKQVKLFIKSAYR